ncbi:hypothetical protein GQ600_16809 [Phytophthora cactorum]|nr:hypothetical protein GQ600_16809 [Phytophthora cactorum]
MSNILTVTALRFEPMLQSAAYASWFEDNLLCTRSTFLLVASFLQEHGIRFAAATFLRKEDSGRTLFFGVSRWVQRGWSCYGHV